MPGTDAVRWHQATMPPPDEEALVEETFALHPSAPHEHKRLNEGEENSARTRSTAAAGGDEDESGGSAFRDVLRPGGAAEPVGSSSDGAHRKQAAGLAAYACAMRCPVLTNRIVRSTCLRARYAMSGAHIAYGGAHTHVVRCPVLTEHIVLPERQREI
eukprot:995673-Rhodomonas_salina.1